MSPTIITKSQPTAGDVHVNTPLTNVVVAFWQRATNFAAWQFFPRVGVDKQSDRYWSIPRGYLNRILMEKRTAGQKAAELGYGVKSDDTYFADVYALRHPIPDVRRKNGDAALRQDRIAARALALQDLMKQEKSFTSDFLKTGVWTGDQTGVAAAPGANQFLQWNDADSSPLKDVAKGKQSVLELTGFEPMDMVIGYPVWVALKNNPEIVDRIKYGGTNGAPGKVTLEAVASLMELDRILVMKGIENTALEGETDSHSFIGGKVALLGYVNPTAELEAPTAGLTFTWDGYTGMQGGARVKSYREEGEAQDVHEIESAWDQKLIAADLGKFFTSAVA